MAIRYKCSYRHFTMLERISMFVIVGLGNPDKKYDKTRHNVGFDVIDCLADELGIDVKTKRHKSLCGVSQQGSEKIVLVKPQTYMNNSGEAVKSIMDFYKLNPATDLIVISDDINLDVGRIRIRKKGSAGGHNGLKNIIAHIKGDEFVRVRVGVGINGGGSDLINHVLGKFSKKERVVIDEKVADAKDAVLEIMKNGADAAMNKFNS